MGGSISAGTVAQFVRNNHLNGKNAMTYVIRLPYM